MKLKIAICDDMNDSCLLLKEYLNELSELKGSSVDIFTSGEKLIESAKMVKYDIIFMDVELKSNYSGMDIALFCKNFNPNCLVIYISGFDCYFPQMVKSDPFSFLDKPFKKEELHNVVKLALKRIRGINDDFSYHFKFNGIIFKIDLVDVLYFESCHRTVKAFLSNGEVSEFYNKLDQVEKEINDIYPYFLRVNKSYLVNYHFMSYSKDFVDVGQIRIKISKKYKNDFYETIERFQTNNL